MRHSRLELHLKSVVDGGAVSSCVSDIRRVLLSRPIEVLVRKARIEISGSWRRGIDIPSTKQVCAFRSGISNTQCGRRRKLLLDSNIPGICHVGLHSLGHQFYADSYRRLHRCRDRRRDIRWKAADAEWCERSVVQLGLGIKDFEERKVPFQKSTYRAKVTREVGNSKGT